ncbi:MAG: peptidoglycan DD-metalloendopeptidase family protein [Clostridia bacterium]|nr:peptidoglycan DD-metalloendopeptidase family protein [Clostridia bacterium]
MQIHLRGAILLITFTLCNLLMVNRFCVGGYDVVAEGETIGFVESAKDVKDITDKMDNELYESYGIDKTLADKINLVEKVDFKNNISDKEELEQKISELSDLICTGYTLLISGNEIITFGNYNDLLITLAKLQQDYMIDNAQMGFCENIEYKKEYVSRKKIFDVENGYNYIKDNMLLNVVGKVREEYASAINYDTVYQEDNTMYKGSTVTVQEGEVGESLVTAEIEYINGEEKSRKVVNEKIIKKPTVQIEKIGNLDPPPGYGTGEFIYPVSGKITSNFGQRWGRLHGGTDIAASSGTPICAADNGTVVFTGESGTYGLLVKVDHGNGFVTYYAHCSQINVSIGDCVAKGETIALVGNTGNSTGPHCHFEIRYNNVQQDPMAYLK